MSGVKGRSGRKRDPDTKPCRATMDEHISPAQWEKIWAALSKAAAEGNIQDGRLLLEYRYGAPRVEPPPLAKPEDHIAYYLPIRPGEKLPPDAKVVKDEPLESTPGSTN